jgi:hypothetical protein
MANFNSNILLVILAAVILIAIIYYLNKNDDQPIPNQGTISNNNNNNNNNIGTNENMGTNISGLINTQTSNNHYSDDISDSIVDELVSQHNTTDKSINYDSGYSASDPMANQYGPFSGYGQKQQLNFRKTELPYSDNEYDQRDFSYKKKKFSKRTPNDIKDLFDVDKMLPQEIEQDWFDVDTLQGAKKIKGTHLIHPKVHMGNNTVGSSLRNATHDIRGDIPNPKISVSPWNNTTIEADINLKGLCNPV